MSMADVRCPMCGKPNPADRDVCQYCQARLKPVRLGDNASASGAKKKEEELPDWLQFGQAGAQPAQPAAESDETDWLKDIMGSSAGYDASRPDSNRVEPEAQDDLDWLSRIGGESAPPTAPAEPASTRERKPPAPQPQSEANEFDWLRGGIEEPPAREDAAPLLSDDDLPDWLKTSGGQGTSRDESSVPDWLSGASLPEPQSQPATPPEMSFPDWLTGAGGPAAAEEFPAGDMDWMTPSSKAAAGAEQFEQAADGGLPDWLAGSGAQAGKADETLDWMSPAVTPPAQPAPSPAAPEVELPDWLAGSETPAAGEQAGDEFDWLKSAGQPAAAQDFFTQAGDAGTPDWFTPVDNQPEAPAQAAQQAAEELPDWLSGVDETAAGEPDWLQAGTGTQAGAGTSAGVEEFDLSSDAGLPDWLVSDQPSTPAGTQAGQSQAAPPSGYGSEFGTESGGGIADWMFNVTEPQAGEEAAPPRPADEPEWLSGESLDWLAAEMRSGEAGGAAADTGEAKRGAPPFGSSALEGDLSWLEDVSSAAPAAPSSLGEEGELFGLASNDLGAFPHDKALPAWLNAEQPETSPEPPAGTENEADLRPAELPNWLQAMRPVGVVNAAEGSEGESPLVAGPLAGLRGVLPAEVDISQVRKPPLYSAHLEVSEQQQAHMALLQSLMAAEGEPRAIPPKPVITSLAVLRLAAAALLIVSILLSLLVNFPAGGVPALPDAAQPAIRLVDGLAADAPVLFAVDYEPGASAEMDALAGAVLAHLIRKGAYVTMVSTVPTGAVQAEHLVVQARTTRGLAFESPADYANLGYISGGAAGLLGFAEEPQRIMPVDLRNQPVWTQGPLQGVTSLGKFSLIVIATENAETMRAWVEQVGTQLNLATPMVALVSAQAEPMVRPYADANPPQLDGMVSGLLGAAAYDGALDQNSPAVMYWNPFSFGMLMATLLSLVVIVFNLVSARLSRRKQSAGSEGKA